jgi:disulfide oxidoreductase YuzD
MKKIVLIDYSIGGHHLFYIRTFSKILLDLGFKVCCVIPESRKVYDWMKEFKKEKLSYFSTHEYDYIDIHPKKWGKFNETVRVLHRWRWEARLIKKLEKDSGERTDIVFYAWVDNNLAPYIPAFVLDMIFPWKWAGLYFHPYHLRQTDVFLNRKAVWRDWDAVFLAKKCISVSVLDSAITEKFSKRIDKPVYRFPDIVDATPPDHSFHLAEKIKEKARDRIIVGMIGCEKHKGTLTLMRAAKQADPEKYFFVFAGILPEQTYSSEEWKEVQQFVHSEPENCFFYFEPIPEGAAYNAVFCVFNIPFLVYDNFISNSNRLKKAAIFEKLVLASDNYCVGDDVRKYDLGEAVPPQNPDTALAGLEKLRKKIEQKDFPVEQWKKYCELNSEVQLYRSFRELMALVK